MATKPSTGNSALGPYRNKRDFNVTPEPRAGERAGRAAERIFVVQKHTAHRAGLHYDFRLEHGGVLWSWAVPKGPSLDPRVRRMAIHVEDHPLDYASFEGHIPEGGYGAGDVETWDQGTWTPSFDPDAGMRKGHLRFTLAGSRLSGDFSLVRLPRKDVHKPEAWLLIKGADDAAREGTDADAIKPRRRATKLSAFASKGAVKAASPGQLAPQLCTAADAPPLGDGWVSEIKFDGYRFLAARDGEAVQLLTRNGHDWADRLPSLAKAIGALDARAVVLDGELVAQGKDGLTSFPALQAALKAGRDGTLIFYAFDLLFLDGWDLRGCTLLDRKAALAALIPGTGMLRISSHHQGQAREMAEQACRMNLEGLVFKRADAAYRSGRGHDWVKVKCRGREELVVIGWTPPGGHRKGIGSLHLGYYDAQGKLHYAGGVGSGFSDADLADLRGRLDRMSLPGAPDMLVAGDPIDAAVKWVRPEIVVEIGYTAWSGAGRVRHGVFLGERTDKPAEEVVREVADPGVARVPLAPALRKGRIVVAQAPKSTSASVAGVKLTHPDRALWPGISKRDLAEYWQSVADVALPGLAGRPLAILRCPDGIEAKERFFQKHGHGIMPPEVRDGMAAKQPYLAIDDVSGLVAMAQMSAIELHPWGATETDPTHPDRLVFDLDPGEGVAFAEVVAAAHEVRARLKRLALEAFCRTSGGKGLHVVVPLKAEAGWDKAKAFCRAFAEAMVADYPDRFVAQVKIADRRCKILVDWLRNGLGATAVASFCPRARPGATVATPLTWREVNDRLDPAAFTVRTVPVRLAKQKTDPWAGFWNARQILPELRTHPAPVPDQGRKGRIVVAKAPARRG